MWSLISSLWLLWTWVHIIAGYMHFSWKTLACLKIITYLQKSVKYLHSQSFPNYPPLHSLRSLLLSSHLTLFMYICICVFPLYHRLLECRDNYLIFLCIVTVKHSNWSMKSCHLLSIYWISLLNFHISPWAIHYHTTQWAIYYHYLFTNEKTGIIRTL